MEEPACQGEPSTQGPSEGLAPVSPDDALKDDAMNGDGPERRVTRLRASVFVPGNTFDTCLIYV